MASPVSARILYTDSEGNLTERTITLVSAGPWGDDAAITAFCHLRRNTRTFLASRIQQLVDLSTGEVVDSPREWALTRPLDFESDSHKAILRQAASEVVALVYVARADGRMMGAERKLIVDFLRSNSNNQELDEGFLDESIRDIHVTDQAFEAALVSLKSRPEEARRQLASFARSILATQKEIHPGEQMAMEALEHALGVSGELPENLQQGKPQSTPSDAPPKPDGSGFITGCTIAAVLGVLALFLFGSLNSGAKPKPELSHAKKQEARDILEEISRMGAVDKHEMGASGMARIWAGPKWEGLTHDQKTTFCSAVLAIHNADGLRVISRNGKTIATYDRSLGYSSN